MVPVPDLAPAYIERGRAPLLFYGGAPYNKGSSMQGARPDEAALYKW